MLFRSALLRWMRSQSLQISVRVHYICSSEPPLMPLVVIPYVDDAKAQAANKDPHLRCLFKELSFAVKDDG